MKSNVRSRCVASILFKTRAARCAREKTLGPACDTDPLRRFATELATAARGALPRERDGSADIESHSTRACALRQATVGVRGAANRRRRPCRPRHLASKSRTPRALEERESTPRRKRHDRCLGIEITSNEKVFTCAAVRFSSSSSAQSRSSEAPCDILYIRPSFLR